MPRIPELGSLRVGDIRHLMVEKPAVEDKKVRDIMNPDPCYVREDTPLPGTSRLPIRERTNELPVVDGEMRVIGQVNVHAPIRRHLELRAAS